MMLIVLQSMKILSFLDVKDLAKLLYTTHQIFVGGFEMNLHSSDGGKTYTCKITQEVEGILHRTGKESERVFLKGSEDGSNFLLYADSVLIAIIEFDTRDNEITDIFPETWFLNRFGSLPLLPYIGETMIFDKEV